MLTYLQFFADHAAYLEPFDDAERGRLFTAMVKYVFEETESDLPGNERFIWPVMKRMLDQSRASLERKQAAGAAGAAGRKSAAEAPEADETTGQADVSTCQANESTCSADVSTCPAEASTPQQRRAKAPIIQEPRPKTQKSRSKSQGPGATGQGLTTQGKTGETHTAVHDRGCFARARGPGGAAISALEGEEPEAEAANEFASSGPRGWYDPADPDADCDDSWRTSDRARAAVAQRMLDYVGREGRLEGQPYPNFHAFLCRLMRLGVHPSVIQEKALGAVLWRDWAARVAQWAYQNPSYRPALDDEEIGRFIPPSLL